ncbi:MAG TPA: class I SAM-dependent methyltransferase, partial [Spirochaetota bacterium]|nr:class I SAM-dependent methyltransferase [Spirochaetota bacterium]
VYMSIQEKAFGGGIDRMPDFSFRIMSFLFLLRDLLTPFDRKLGSFGIDKGDTVIDYGCGPGSYLSRSSALTGPEGKVFAADIHELAIQSVNRRIKEKKLNNVEAVKIDSYKCPLPDNTADIIYALDMFHMVKEPQRFLNELHRLLKKDGKLIIDDGHQSRKKSLRKISDSNLWDIAENRKGWIVAVPKKS